MSVGESVIAECYGVRLFVHMCDCVYVFVLRAFILNRLHGGISRLHSFYTEVVFVHPSLLDPSKSI